jgi:spore coat polysaccharide biosynthesis protein SpsF
VLATTELESDDVLENWADENGVHCYRGSSEDVLNRVVNAHRMIDSDIVVEVTGDCPLLDPEIIDMGVATYFANHCDVVENVATTSYPQGIDVQVYALSLLEDVEKRINDAAVREHVSLYFYENPEQYRLLTLVAPARWQAPELRFQLDYPEDLEFIRKVYGRLEPRFGSVGFGVGEIIDLLNREPSLRSINAHCVEKSPR